LDSGKLRFGNIPNCFSEMAHTVLGIAGFGPLDADRMKDLRIGQHWLSPQGGHWKDVASQTVEALISLRNEARAAKNFAQADAIRKRLDEIGILLEDTPEGTKWRFK